MTLCGWARERERECVSVSMTEGVTRLGLFLKNLVTKFLTKVAQISISDILEFFTFYNNCSHTFLGNREKLYV